MGNVEALAQGRSLEGRLWVPVQPMMGLARHSYGVRQPTHAVIPDVVVVVAVVVVFVAVVVVVIVVVVPASAASSSASSSQSWAVSRQ